MPVRRAAKSGRWPGSTPNSPSTLGAVSSVTCSLSFTPSGVMICKSMCAAAIGASARLLHLFGGGLDLVDVALEVERLLGQIIERAAQDLLEGGDGLLERHVLAGQTRELARDEERLRQELLDAAGAPHHEPVVFAELVHAQDGDDVLQVLVTLQRLLHPARHPIVLFTNDVRIEHGA